MMKNVKKRQKFDTRLCYVLQCYYDINTAFFQFLTFKRTESRDQVICLMLDWHKHPEHVC